MATLENGSANGGATEASAAGPSWLRLLRGIFAAAVPPLGLAGAVYHEGNSPFLGNILLFLMFVCGAFAFACQYFLEAAERGPRARRAATCEWLFRLAGFCVRCFFKSVSYLSGRNFAAGMILVFGFHVIWIYGLNDYGYNWPGFSQGAFDLWHDHYLCALAASASSLFLVWIMPRFLDSTPEEYRAVSSLLANVEKAGIDARKAPIVARRHTLKRIMTVDAGEVRCFAIHFNDFVGGSFDAENSFEEFLRKNRHNKVRLIMHNPFHPGVRARSRYITGRYRTDYVEPFFENVRKIASGDRERAQFRVHNEAPLLRFFLLPDVVICQTYEKDCHGFRSPLQEFDRQKFRAAYDYFAQKFEEAWNCGTLVREEWIDRWHMRVTLRRAAYVLGVKENLSKCSKTELRTLLRIKLSSLGALESTPTTTSPTPVRGRERP